jgi:hypothetical protein
MWLLQACLLSGALAQEAWKKWTQRVDINKVDPASRNLLPLVSRNQALPQDFILKKCAGTYRQAWVENQLKWNQTIPILKQLQKGGIDQIVLLKGIALVLQTYCNFGVRAFGDIDILIDRAHVSNADSILRNSGWKQKVWFGLDFKNPKHLSRWHALNYVHPDGMNLDLHWSLLEEVSPALDEAVLRDARKISVGDLCLHVPNPTDLLLHACVHGLKYSPTPLIRWIADAMTLLKASKAEIDWERLVDLATKARATLPISTALTYLNDHFDAGVPQTIIQKLQAIPPARLERLEYRSNLHGNGDLARWHRYCMNQGYLTLRSRLSHIIEYLQTTARLKSPWLIPFYGLYWIMKRLRRL